MDTDRLIYELALQISSLQKEMGEINKKIDEMHDDVRALRSDLKKVGFVASLPTEVRILLASWIVGTIIGIISYLATK